jgi:hypothetical protein
MAQEPKSSSCLLCVLIPLLLAPRPPSTRSISTPCRQGHQTLADALSLAIRLREHGTAGQTGFGPHTPVAQQPEGFPEEPVFEVECPLGHTTFPTISGVSTTANVFRKEGEYWTVSYEGTVVRLRNRKGLHYLDQLLHHPGREFHVLDLIRIDGAYSSRGPTAPHRVLNESGPGVTAAQGRLHAPLDAKAKQAYRHRLTDLHETLQEAEQFADAVRSERTRGEIEFLTHQLSAAMGLGGRDRPTGAPAERARVAVTLRIRDALRRIRQLQPSLGIHLDASVRTGYFCSYSLPPYRPIQWTI